MDIDFFQIPSLLIRIIASGSAASTANLLEDYQEEEEDGKGLVLFLWG